MTSYRLFGYNVHPHSLYPGGRPREIFIDKLGVKTERLEYLGSVVALHRGDAYLGHYLHYALNKTFHVPRDRFLVRHAHKHVLVNHAV